MNGRTWYSVPIFPLLFYLIFCGINIQTHIHEFCMEFRLSMSKCWTGALWDENIFSFPFNKSQYNGLAFKYLDFPYHLENCKEKKINNTFLFIIPQKKTLKFSFYLFAIEKVAPLHQRRCHLTHSNNTWGNRNSFSKNRSFR